MYIKQNNSIRNANMYKILGDNFKNCKDKVMVLVPVLEKSKNQIDKIIEKIKQKRGVDLNKDDIAIYGYVYDPKKQKEELHVKTNSELINRIKPKPYNAELWKFICSEKIKTIYFYGSFNKAIEKKIEDKKLGKMPLKDLIDKKDITSILIPLSRETSVFNEKTQTEFFLYGLKCDIESLIGDEMSYQINGRVMIKLRIMLQRIKKRPDICDINIWAATTVLEQLAGAECFIPVPMFLDVLKKTQENSLFAEKLFSKRETLMHRDFPIPKYNHEFQAKNKSIDFEKCDKKLERLYNKLKKMGCPGEILDIMTTRIYCEKDIAKIKILCLPSSKISSYTVERNGQSFEVGGKFKSKLNKKTKSSIHVPFEEEFKKHFDSVKNKLYQIKNKKRNNGDENENYGEWRLKKVLWKPSKS